MKDNDKPKDLIIGELLEMPGRNAELGIFFNLSQDLLCVVDFKGCIKRLNRAGEILIGYTAEEIIEKSCLCFIHPDDLDSSKDTCKKAKKESTAVCRYQNRIRCKDGSYKWVEWTTLPVPEFQLFYSAGRDVTGIKFLEHQFDRANRQIMSIIESIKDVFFVLDNQWRFTYVNFMAEKHFGRKKDQLVGRNIWTEFSSYLGSRFYREYHRAMSEQKAVHFEEFIPSLLRWVEVSAYPSAEGISVYLRDISARKQSELKLRESQERYRSLFENSADGIILNRPDGAIVAANPAACRMFGLSEEELRRAGIASIIDMDDPGYKKAVKEMACTGKFKCETVLKRKDGAKFPGELSASLFRGRDDRYLTSLIINDISQRKRTEEMLLLLANIVESSNDAVISGSPDGTIISWNPGAENIFNYSAEEIIGENFSILMPAESREEFGNDLERVAMGFGLKNYKTICLKKGDSPINVSISISPLKGADGKITGFSSIVRDISEQIKIEMEMARLDRLNLVGQMAAGIGHEIRNPMTSVRGFLQLLQGRKECTSFSEYFKLMIGELDRANAIITEYLAVARDRPVEQKMRDINSIVEAMFPLINADAINENKNVRLDLGEVPELLLDEKEIRQLILNLARNGLEAMSTGGCMAIRTSREGENVVLSVQDQGVGIDPEVLERLGTPFFTTKEKGTGLGLATCYSIAARHNATIEIETGSQGTTFFIIFKIAPAHLERNQK
ncbi:signal transduction histidine kinase [Desulfocucumis palustris]|uniref:histidine kinase n=1 Tax=Desulfocucumis palustris TaxID=1898651 RepID=A0A2L2XFZ1_9FIRM|nr:PAS domain S-box protein [Desulfocucumis palustris]GBF35042.1 signal transduction histidine kinase [Desulfocucumis palustris]